MVSHWTRGHWFVRQTLGSSWVHLLKLELYMSAIMTGVRGGEPNSGSPACTLNTLRTEPFFQVPNHGHSPWPFFFNWFVLRFIFIFKHVWVINLSPYDYKQSTVLDALELGLQAVVGCPVWGLRTKLWSSSRPASSLHCWAVSLTPCTFILVWSILIVAIESFN